MDRREQFWERRWTGCQVIARVLNRNARPVTLSPGRDSASCPSICANVSTDEPNNDPAQCAVGAVHAMTFVRRNETLRRSVR